MSGLVLLVLGVAWAAESAAEGADTKETMDATANREAPVPTDGGTLRAALSDAVGIALVRAGSVSADAGRRERAGPPGGETDDERFARSHSDYERMVVRVELESGFGDGNAKTVKVEVFEDAMGTRLVTATRYTLKLTKEEAMTLPDASFAALWESATKADGHDTTLARRPLLVRVSVEDGGSFVLVHQRLLTVVYNPRFVPSAVTLASLVGVQVGEDGAASADLVSFAPAGFHLRYAPLPRTPWIGLAANLALLDTSAFSAGDSSGDAAAEGEDTPAVALQPGVMPARFTAGVDATYNHGFFDGKHLYFYGGVGLVLKDASKLGLAPVFGASLVVPIDFSSN